MKKAIILLLFCIIGIAVFPVFLPKNIHQEVEYIYDAEPAKVYDYFNNLKKMSLWFNWKQGEVTENQYFSSPSQGVGAEYSWKTANANGRNKVIITENKELQFVGYHLNFGEYEGNTSEAIFQILDDGKVKVIWTFDSAELSYPYQVYNFIMKHKVKDLLERGLKKLEVLLEKEKTTTPSRNESSVTLENHAAKTLLGIVQTVTKGDEAEYKTALEESFGMVESYLLDEREMSFPSIENEIVYTLHNDNKEQTFIAGFFIEEKIYSLPEGMQIAEIPAGKILCISCERNKESIEKAYEKAIIYAKNNHLKPLSNYWLSMLDDSKAILKIPVEGK